MKGPSTEIRSATPDELPHAVAAIVAAFITDPVARFAWPSPREHLLGMPMAAGVMAAAGLEHRSSYVSADFCGAALWLPPGVHPDSETIEKIFRDTVRPDRLDDTLATFEKMGQSHPDEPHWYLPMIGVEPQAQGRGLGSELMRHALKRCDQDGVVAYLESSNPRNISLYLRHGFEVMTEIRIGAAPLVTPMLRRPR